MTDMLVVHFCGIVVAPWTSTVCLSSLMSAAVGGKLRWVGRHREKDRKMILANIMLEQSLTFGGGRNLPKLKIWANAFHDSHYLTSKSKVI